MRMTLFRMLVQERGWTTVERFNVHFSAAAVELAAQTGESRLADVTVMRRSFDRWIGGELKQKPQVATRRILEHLFQVPAERLFAPMGPAASLEESRVRSQLGFDTPFDIATQTQRLTGSNTYPAVLDQVQVSLDSIVERYETLGPQQLVGEARLLRKMLHTMLAGQQPPRARRELFRLAGHAAGLLAYMAINAGAGFEVSEAYCVEAESLGEDIGDVSLQMWAAGTRSLALYYQHRYAEADAAAAAGIALAPTDAQAVRLLSNGRARAQARMGDRKGAERSIGQALEVSDRQTSLPPGITSCIAFSAYSPARTLANVITARLSLNDTEDVLRCAGEINGLVEQSDSGWSRALVGLDVATAFLQQRSPDVERAMSLGRSALGTGTTAPIRSVWQRANELHATAERWHHVPVVRDYAEELRTWGSRPQAELVVSGVSVDIEQHK